MPSCRFCQTPLTRSFADLALSPLANAYVPMAQAERAEKFYPLHARVCESCLLVQLESFETPDAIFGDYLYFSSFSTSWLQHARRYTEMMSERFGIGPRHQVVEIASNDGYLLRWFKERGIPVLGVEPAANVAQVALDTLGIESLVKFFGVATAREMAAAGRRADLLLGNNVLAHVPDLNDFVAGMKIALKPDGILTMEFPHLLQLMRHNQFDTIYHEHFSYFSFTTVEKVFARHGLTLFDVDELPTHGGSLRIYGRHAESAAHPVTPRVAQLKAREAAEGLLELETYSRFGEKVKEVKRKLLVFLIEAKRAGRRVVGYGAPAKGNTLLNYCGVYTDFLDYTVDKSPHKQGHLLPGTRIPIHAPAKIAETRPDFVLILPWNLKEEIAREMEVVRSWGGQFVVPIPEVTVF